MKYLVVINKAQNNYGAHVPDVPGCISTGNTFESTLKNIKEALGFHLYGEQLPEPKGLKYWIDNLEDTANDESIFCFVEINF